MIGAPAPVERYISPGHAKQGSETIACVASVRGVGVIGGVQTSIPMVEYVATVSVESVAPASVVIAAPLSFVAADSEVSVAES